MASKKELTETLQIAIDNALANTHTQTVAVVTAVNEKTIDVQPVINRLFQGKEKQLPVFTKVPPVFMSGGESRETYPIKVGDYCLLCFCERSFDRWYDGDDFKLPPELRMHDYSDAFAIVGLRNKAGSWVIPNRIEQHGDKYKEGNHEHAGNLTHNGNTTQTGDYNQTGNQTVDGDQSTTGNTESGTYSAGGTAGWSGAFATGDGRTATVKSGLITDVS